ncbi:MAG: methyltransferase domain-containing protein [Betaproteobacteria bacterium]|uniref:Methyltransferase domain-containing protein n=1 Tax=Candidatus Proximibacter danicus TaxID=2954365 RepID=A0A9D7K2I6_9PROT|nr:methyltransferase domain-containing protein [Candidatus Proximibacter danicus]
MKKLNVGCGRNAIAGWVNLDCVALPGVDIVADLESCDTQPLPIESDTVDEFLLQHVLEHIRNPLPLMQELHRIARPGALAVIRTPYGSTDDAWEDPTHVRPYFPEAWILGQPLYWRADYGYRGDWQTERIVLMVPRARAQGRSADAVMELVHRERNVVAEMHAELRAVKPIRLPQRELQQLPRLELQLVDL